MDCEYITSPDVDLVQYFPLFAPCNQNHEFMWNEQIMTARIRQNNICSTSDQFGVNNVILMAFHSIICFLALSPSPAYDWKHSLKHPAKCKLEALKTGYGTNDGCVSTIWIYECWKRIPLLLMVKLSYDGDGGMKWKFWKKIKTISISIIFSELSRLTRKIIFSRCEDSVST